MIKKAIRTGLLVAATAASLSAVGATTASAQGFGIYLGGLGIHTGYWGSGYYGRPWHPYWRPGFVRYNGCPAYYVREANVCYPTW